MMILDVGNRILESSAVARQQYIRARVGNDTDDYASGKSDMEENDERESKTLDAKTRPFIDQFDGI